MKAAYAKAGLYKPDFDYDVTDLAPEEFIQRLAQAPLAYQPGTTWEYSLAVDVLGRVVAAHDLGYGSAERGIGARVRWGDVDPIVRSEVLADLAVCVEKAR